MRYINLSILVIFLLLSILGAYAASQNMCVNQIVGGGYLYRGDGIVAMWDRWEQVDVPIYWLPFYIPFYILFRAPLWFQVLYLPTVLWVALVYIFPHLLTGRSKV